MDVVRPVAREGDERLARAAALGRADIHIGEVAGDLQIRQNRLILVYGQTTAVLAAARAGALKHDVFPLRLLSDIVDYVLGHGLHLGWLADGDPFRVLGDIFAVAVKRRPLGEYLARHRAIADLGPQLELRRPRLARGHAHEDAALLARGGRVRLGRRIGIGREEQVDSGRLELAHVLHDAAWRLRRFTGYEDRNREVVPPVVIEFPRTPLVRGRRSVVQVQRKRHFHQMCEGHIAPGETVRHPAMAGLEDLRCLQVLRQPVRVIVSRDIERDVLIEISRLIDPLLK